MGIRAGATDPRQPPVAAPRSHAADSRDGGHAADDARDGAVADGVRRDTATATTAPGCSRPRTARTSCAPHVEELPAALRRNYQSARTVTRWSASRYARYMRSDSNVRDTLGDFVNQYAGYAQTTDRSASRAACRSQTTGGPVPGRRQPGRSSPTARRTAATPTSAARSSSTSTSCAADQRSVQPLVPAPDPVGTSLDLSYFFNYGIARAVTDINLNMMDPAFKYEYKTAAQQPGAEPVPQLPHRRQVPRYRSRNAATVTLGSLLKPYPQYGDHRADQHERQEDEDAQLRGARPAAVRQGPQLPGRAYAYSYERIQQWYDDLATYKVLTSGGEEGWEWRPPRRRCTG